MLSAIALFQNSLLFFNIEINEKQIYWRIPQTGFRGHTLPTSHLPYIEILTFYINFIKFEAYLYENFTFLLNLVWGMYY